MNLQQTLEYKKDTRQTDTSAITDCFSILFQNGGGGGEISLERKRHKMSQKLLVKTHTEGGKKARRSKPA